MTKTTWEEAKCCPRCGVAGEDKDQQSGPRGSKIHVIFCRTEGCRWQDTSWIVQVNRDGSIPIRQPGDKEFPALNETQKQHARDVKRFNQDLLERGELPPR